MYAKIEQPISRRSGLICIMDWLILFPNETNATELGRIIILPSSYTNSPRQMFQLYQAAVLFITFTCNPLWDEIRCNFLLNQEATDCPDLIVRLFIQKLRELLNDILEFQ